MVDHQLSRARIDSQSTTAQAPEITVDPGQLLYVFVVEDAR
jgi:hypothetical protein